MVIRTALFLFMANTVLAQECTVTKVVDTQTIRPDGKGTFGVFEAAIDNGIVVFQQGAYCAGCPSPDSIWAMTGDGIVKLADTDTPIPGGKGNFAYFEGGGKPLVRNGTVVFVAGDADSKTGLYTVPAGGGDVQRIADTTVVVPRANNLKFISFANRIGTGLASDGTTVLFEAEGPGMRGIYSALWNGTELDRVADTNTPVNSPQCDVFPSFLFTNPTLGDGGIVFRGQTVFDSSNGFNAFYNGVIPAPAIGPNCQPYPTVVNSAMNLPGAEANAHTRFDYGQADGIRVVVRADDANSNFGGLFQGVLGTDGSLETIVDVKTDLPGMGPAGYVNNYRFAARDGAVVFQASVERNHAIFKVQDGSIARMVGTGDEIDGKQVSTVAIGPNAWSVGTLVFAAFFRDFTSGIYTMSCTQ